LTNQAETSGLLTNRLKFLKRHLSNLQCLHCNGKLHANYDERIECFQCKSYYPIINGVPVIINEEKSIFSFADFQNHKNLFFDISLQGNLKAKISSLLPALSFNKISRQNFDLLLDKLKGKKAKASVLILGGSIEGQGISKFINSPSLDIIESDVSFGPKTQIILDAHDIPFQAETFDCVIAQAVLEHVVDPQQCVSEIYRVLKPGGFVYSEIPFMQQVHGGAYDFTRYTLSGHRRLFRKFEQLKAGAVAGPGTALGWSYMYFLFSLFAYTDSLKLFLKFFARITGFWLKYFDYFTINSKRSIDGASVTFFIGSKSNETLSDRQLIKYY
jgi:SAM-dependent methyltransferase/uncharacterized protein YbaR (Trm112 family)